MRFEIEGNPDYGEVIVELGPGEELLAEPGAMSRMSSNMEAQSKRLGSFFGALIRKMFGGESFFVGRFTHPDGGSVTIAPRLPGTVTHRQMNGDSVFLTAGAFLACTPGLTVKAKFGGLRALFSGEGAFLVEVSGTGELFYNAYGGVVEQTVAGKFTVDTGHLVAFEPSLQYTIGGMGNLKSTFLSGEGLVIKFQGNGKVWVQTRTLDGLAGWLTPRL
jgi:uncharacterized protein (TIGR00266 family)